MRDNGLRAILQSYNAQLAVDGHRQIIIAAEVTQEANDKQQLLPMIKAASKAVADEPVTAWLADAGYWSESQLTDEALADRNLLVSHDAEAGGKDKLTENNSLAERIRNRLEKRGGTLFVRVAPRYRRTGVRAHQRAKPFPAL